MAPFGSGGYAREELVAEMASAFVCASLSIRPTVRHADYLGAWLAVLREDERAILRAARAASRAADYLMDMVDRRGFLAGRSDRTCRAGQYPYWDQSSQNVSADFGCATLADRTCKKSPMLSLYI